MPQMAPMMWTTMFITFSLLFITIMTKTFFIFTKITPNTETSSLVPKKLNWMW